MLIQDRQRIYDTTEFYRILPKLRIAGKNRLFSPKNADENQALFAE